MNVSLSFTGPNARAAADEVAALLGREWGVPAAPEVPALPHDARLDAETLSTALLLNLPATALLAWSVADRLKLVQRVQALLARLGGAAVTVSLPGQGPVPAAMLTPATVLAAAPVARPAHPPVTWDVFLAHAGPDLAEARAIHDRVALRRRVFLDAVCLPGGAPCPRR